MTLSFVTIFANPKSPTGVLAIIIGIVSLTALFVTAPLYKRSVIDVLEVLQEELDLHTEENSEKPPRATSRKATDITKVQ